VYKLDIAKLASEDLDHIFAYIADNLSNIKAAANFLDEVEACYAKLMNNPYIYAKCLDKRLEALGYRKAVIKNYIVVYAIDEAIKTVRIIRFFYGAQNYLNKV